ncbi:hypothetical protein GWK47_048741 [Chionoecetes opilio]|uniref:Uncharacterized protein n=1 Tax=Chionoecetes opilio TaxID=41210 RepID=A0A8J4YFC9_CHIOP|nr:hypothetical protein GWK47_048741 [Chionoecetes opilio]
MEGHWEEMSCDSDTSPNFPLSAPRSQDETEAANMLMTLSNSSRSTTPAGCFSPLSISPRAIQSPITVGPKCNVFMPISQPGVALTSPTGRHWTTHDINRHPIPLLPQRHIIRPELLRPVTKLPTTLAHVAGGTSVIRASPSQGVPVGLTNPQDLATHQASESVIQERRFIHNAITRGITINNQLVATHQGHASRVLAPGLTVTSANSQSTVAILEKVLTSTVPNTAKAHSDSQPQDLSNRFHPVDSSGFSGDRSIVVGENMSSSGERNAGENSGEQEGLLLRANSAAVRDGMISIPEHASFSNGATKQDVHDDKNNVIHQVKSELTTLASPFTTNGGAVIITTQHRGHGTAAGPEHVVIHTQGAKEEITVEAKWDNQQQQQQGQQTYHWSQLVPFITAPSKSVIGQQQAKVEVDVKPAVNGDVTVNGKGHAGSTSDARVGEGGQSRRESCGQEVEGELSADDDEVFVSETDASTPAATDNKRTRSLGSFSGKEEPKSPRKVKYRVQRKRLFKNSYRKRRV